MNTKMIAHRGYSEKETENTIQSFILAAKDDYFYGLECDVHLTKDGHFIVNHDGSTGRLANKDKIIKESTLKDLRELDLININTEKYDKEYKIPFLSDYLKICNEYNKKAVIEIKPSLTEKELQSLVSEIERYLNLDNVIFISFDLRNLILLRKINKYVKMQLLLSYFTEELIEICRVLKMDLDFRFNIPNLEIMEKLHKNDIKVNVWTVNDTKEKLNFKLMNVDFITTDNKK